MSEQHPTSSSPNLPGGPMPEWSRFNLRRDLATDTDIGFIDPQGSYFPLGEGETLVHISNDDTRDRDTFVQLGDTLTPFDTWKDSGHDRSDKVHEPKLDKARLNEVMRASLETGVYFGKGLELTNHDKEQFELIASKVEAILEPMYEDPDWQAFMKLVDEGNTKGVLMAFTVHEGTDVPTWCVDGGNDSDVKKIIRRATDGSDAPGIQVPRKVFNLYHWQNTVKGLRRYATFSNDGLKGTSTRYLGQTLKQLAGFVKKMEQNELGQAQ